MGPPSYATLCRWPSSMQVGKSLPDLHTRRSPTKSGIYQMSCWYNWFSWWWARVCSKHVENWNKRIEKRIVRQVGCLQKYTKMHGQQNIKPITQTTCFVVPSPPPVFPYMPECYRKWDHGRFIPYTCEFILFVDCTLFSPYGAAEA